MTLDQYTYVVAVDGTDLTDVTVEGARITYGRNDPNDAITPPVCVLDMLTDIGTNIWATVEPLSTVTIDANTPTGYVDTYADVYAGATYRRFTGHVIAQTYEPLEQRSQVTLVGNLEFLARQLAKTGNYTEQNDVARLTKIVATDGGLSLTTEGAGSVAFLSYTAPSPAQPVNALQLASTYAYHASGFLFEDTDGTITYRSANATAPVVGALVPNSVSLARTQMAREVGDIINTVSVVYGNPQATHTGTDSTSVSLYGTRARAIDTELKNLADAQSLANVQLANYDTPFWSMPFVEVMIEQLRLEDAAVTLQYGIGDRVTVTQLTSDGPLASYTSTILGYDEQLTRSTWRVNFHLASQGWTAAAIQWDDVPNAHLWTDVPAGVTWNEALTLTDIGV